MAHEFETGFFVGKAAWHGLGTVIQEAPSISEAIQLAGLDWTVRTEPLVLASDGRPANAQVTVRDTDNRILGLVGEDYQILQNSEAFNWMDPFIQDGSAQLETAGSLRQGERIWVLAKLTQDPIVIAGDDDVQAYLLLSNGHDGKLACRVGFTPIRVVCHNTLSMAHDSGASKLLRVKHRGDMLATLDSIREIMNLVTQDFEASAEQYQALAQRQINTEDFEQYVRKVFRVKPPQLVQLKAALEGTEPKESDAKTLLNKITPLFESGRGNDLPGVKGTWWAAYNSVTEYLTHERGRTQDSRLDSLWFGAGMGLNRKALKLASEMSA